MGFNGNGTFNINTAGQPVVAGTTISSTAFNALTADLATGLTDCITRDGQSPATANIPLGNNKITGLANGTVATDAAAFGQLSTFGVPGYTTTATAAGTTTLTVASTTNQFFTGITTQTVVLPVTSTLVLGFRFRIVNNSTGIVTVNSSGSNLVASIPGSTEVTLTCILTSGTTAASWDLKFAGVTTETGTGGLVRDTSAAMTTPTITSATLVTPALGTPASGALTNCTSIPGAQINAGTVANTALAQMAANTLKGNNTGSTANAADLTVAQTKTLLGVTTVGTATVGQIPGTATNDSATAGNVGEYVSSSIASGSAVSLSNGVPTAITSISLTAGDWMVSFIVYFNGGATTTVNYLIASMSTVSSTSINTTLGFVASQTAPGSVLFPNANVSFPVGAGRLSISGTTTLFAAVQAGFGTSTCNGFGILQAWRIR